MMNKEHNMATAANTEQASSEIGQETFELKKNIDTYEKMYKEVSLIKFKTGLVQKEDLGVEELVKMASNDLIEFLMNKDYLLANFSLNQLQTELGFELKVFNEKMLEKKRKKT